MPCTLDMGLTKEEKAKFQLFQKNQVRIQRVQSSIRRLKRWRNRLDILAAFAFIAQIASGVLVFFVLGPSKNGPGYLMVTELIAGFGKSFSITLRAIVQTFAFVGYAASGIRALWDIGVTLYSAFFVHSANNITSLNPRHRSIAWPTSGHFLVRTAANLLMAAFNIIAVITVLGLFSTGIGLVFAVVATGIGWIKDSVIPWYRTRKTIKELGYELQQLKERPHYLESDCDKLCEQIKLMQAECESKRNSMILNAVSFIAFALFATGPFGLITLGMVGSVLLVACTVVGVGRIIYNSCNNNALKQAVTRQDILKSDEESELEFYQRIKFHHWMEETAKKLDATYPLPAEAPTHFPAIIQIKRAEDVTRPEVRTARRPSYSG